MLERRPYGDAVVTGYGTIFGRKVCVFSQDFTVFGGSLSEVSEKIRKVMDWPEVGCPSSASTTQAARASRKALCPSPGYAEIFWRNVQCSGVIPESRS
jgi:propionyl-CoA carboxylase beta chain